ncbi:double zinc ribbon domain-containing protein [Haloarcula nitratireducens]|uniref:Zinc ribbon domain-containing protein n=1 Tax=Haloarcula nitratireducens TaxID=2487749 RepID=A0AAW4PIR5_9EURY|nr:zinc ribbon domain-containing protein [Halomicroarcula nitratireducens]MBX0297170.1 zinc ribbon domain-containing protein [Halomicroarcula nitratireducens]
MSKITFRADDDLIERLEAFDASKSEVMREALRAYLDGSGDDPSPTRSDSAESTGAESVTDTESIDELIAERVDAIITDRLPERRPARQPQDVNVNISLDAERGAVATEQAAESHASDAAAADAADDVSHGAESRKTPTERSENAEPGEQISCAQCGENLSEDHVYCPNCGEKASRRVFCDCGDEIRSDWGFCPSCGRRTPAADVLDRSRSGANER